MPAPKLVHPRKLWLALAVIAGLGAGCSNSEPKPATKSAEDQLLEMGVPGKLAAYLGAVKIEVFDSGPDRYRYRETFPDGPSRVITINLRHNVTHVASDTELDVGGGVFLTEYNPDPKDGAFAFKYLVPEADAAKTLTAPQSIAAPGSRVLAADGSDKGFLEVFFDSTVSASFGEVLGNTGELVGKGKALPAGIAAVFAALDVLKAGEMSLDHQNWMDEMDTLEAAVKDPSNALTATDPDYQSRTLELLAERRAELQQISSARFLQLMTEVGAGVIPPLAIALAGVLAWNDAEFVALANDLLDKARQAVVTGTYQPPMPVTPTDPVPDEPLPPDDTPPTPLCNGTCRTEEPHFWEGKVTFTESAEWEDQYTDGHTVDSSLQWVCTAPFAFYTTPAVRGLVVQGMSFPWIYGYRNVTDQLFTGQYQATVNGADCPTAATSAYDITDAVARASWNGTGIMLEDPPDSLSFTLDVDCRPLADQMSEDWNWNRDNAAYTCVNCCDGEGDPACGKPCTHAAKHDGGTGGPPDLGVAGLYPGIINHTLTLQLPKAMLSSMIGQVHSGIDDVDFPLEEPDPAADYTRQGTHTLHMDWTLAREECPDPALFPGEVKGCP